MRQLEIIHLRSSDELAETLSEQIRESVREAEGDIKAVTLYRRRGLHTDVAIHINHLEGLEANELSRLGIRLASALKAYGLVEHTLWEELT